MPCACMTGNSYSQWVVRGPLTRPLTTGIQSCLWVNIHYKLFIIYPLARNESWLLTLLGCLHHCALMKINLALTCINQTGGLNGKILTEVTANLCEISASFLEIWLRFWPSVWPQKFQGLGKTPLRSWLVTLLWKTWPKTCWNSWRNLVSISTLILGVNVAWINHACQRKFKHYTLKIKQVRFGNKVIFWKRKRSKALHQRSNIKWYLPWNTTVHVHIM